MDVIIYSKNGRTVTGKLTAWGDGWVELAGVRFPGVVYWEPVSEAEPLKPPKVAL